MQDDNEFFYNDEFQQLLSEYESAIKEGRPITLDADELTDIAEYYMTIFKEKRANKAISLALEMYPDSLDPWIFVARKHLFDNQIDEAEQICSSLAEQNDREIIFLKAEIMIKKEMYKEAFDFFLAEASMMEEDRGMFLFDCAQVFEDYQLWKEAHQFAMILKQEYPHFSKAKLLEVEILMGEGKFLKSITLLESILDNDPYNINAWNMLAESYVSTENIDSALECLEYVFAIEKDNYKAIITKGNCRYIQELPAEAHELYARALSLRPGDAKIYYLDSICLSNLGHYPEALEQTKNAIKVSQGMPTERMQIYMHKAFIESKLHNLSAAFVSLDKAVGYAKEVGTIIDYYLMRGEILLENSLKEEAMDSFAKAIIESKDPLQTKINICTALGEHGCYHEAEELLLKVIEDYGNEAHEAYGYLAYCYIFLKDDNKFLEYLRKSAEVDPETTRQLFARYFPEEVKPEMYYALAYWTIKGKKPNSCDEGFNNLYPNINFKID